jgi:hypothetical protein
LKAVLDKYYAGFMRASKWLGRGFTRASEWLRNAKGRARAEKRD